VTAVGVTAANRVLIRLPNWLGDVLLARPLLHRLRAALPGAVLTAVAPAPLLDLLAADGVVDAAQPWPRDRAGRAAALAAVRAARPDAALVLPPSFSSAWLAWRSGAAERVGYAHEGRDVLLTRALRRPARGERHLSDEYLELGRAAFGAAAVTAGDVPSLRLTATARDAGAALRERLDVAPRAYAVLAPAAIYGPAKRWPAERFAALGRRLAARGAAVLVCGTREEAAVCEAVAREAGAGARSLAGTTTLPELAGLCADARLAVCNDSGLAHLAAALGVPTVAVFGSTSSAWTAPRGAAVRIVQRPPVCSPCFRRDCRIGTVCLTRLDEARVWNECERLLEERAA
jgi:heptosyltransferase II